MAINNVNSISSSWGYTNTTASTHTLTPVAVGLATNYSKPTITSSDNNKGVKVKYQNATCPDNQHEELIIEQFPIANVVVEETNINPPKRVKGKLTTFKLQAKKRNTSSTDDTFVVDYSNTLTLTYKVTEGSNLTDTEINNQLLRLLGALQDSSGNLVIGKVLRGQLDI